jgi:hypothetical protein
MEQQTKMSEGVIFSVIASILALVIAISIASYLFIYLPHKEKVASEQKKQQQQKRAEEDARADAENSRQGKISQCKEKQAECSDHIKYYQERISKASDMKEINFNQIEVNNLINGECKDYQDPCE